MDQPTEKSLVQFIAENRLLITAGGVPYRPDGFMSDIRGTRHYLVTISTNKRHMSIYYSAGPAIKGEPTVEDIVSCLILDASSFENAPKFEEFAREFGYKTDDREDMRKARSVHAACKRQASKFRALLGEAAYWEAMSGNVEQL